MRGAAESAVWRNSLSPRAVAIHVLNENSAVDDGRRATLTQMVASDPRRLRRRSISLGVPADDADDVAQIALLHAWRAIEKLHAPEPGQMCSWLDTIARNAATDLARQRARRPTVALEDDVPGGRNMVADVETRVLLDGVLGALRDLPESLREPLLLQTVEQLSAQEIALRLGITPSAVRQRVARARKALTACKRSGMSDQADVIAP